MTRGEHIAQAVRDHLQTNGLTQKHLTGAVLAEIADRCLAHLEKLKDRKLRLATEGDWIREVESLPHLAGVDVRKELAKCQFWCKTNGKPCTKKRFTNWLSKDDLARLVSPGGSAERPRAANGVEASFPGWLAVLNELFPESVQARGGLFEIKAESDYEWGRLDGAIRKAICGEAARR